MHVIIEEVITQCPGDPRVLSVCAARREAAVPYRTALPLERGALPMHHLNRVLPAGNHQLLVTAAASLFSEPVAGVPSPNPVLVGSTT